MFYQHVTALYGAEHQASGLALLWSNVGELGDGERKMNAAHDLRELNTSNGDSAKHKGKEMRSWIAGFLLCFAANAFGGIAVGDSLTAGADDWCYYQNTQGRHWKCLAQSMRFAASYELPPDLAPVDGHKTLVYWLLNNDALFWNDPNPEVRQSIQDAANAQLLQAIHAGFNVLVILPPTLDCSPSQNGLERDMKSVRLWLRYIVAVYQFYGLPMRSLDPDDHNYADNTIDCAHPTQPFSQYWGGVVQQIVDDWEAE